LVSKQHPRVVLDVQLVVDAGEARVLAALHREYRLRFVLRLRDRHPVAGTGSEALTTPATFLPITITERISNSFCLADPASCGGH
jgi:hypothetical protein